MYRCLKNEYFQNRIYEYRNSPKQFWSAINYITGRQDQRLAPSVNLIELASHFWHLLTQPQSKHNLSCPDGPDVERSLFEIALVSPAEVEKLLNGLNPSKASGPDNISSAELLSCLQNVLLEELRLYSMNRWDQVTCRPSSRRGMSFLC